MIPAIWPVSLVPEAALAAMYCGRSGFSRKRWFFRLLACNLAANLASMASAGSQRVYPILNAACEVTTIVLLAMAVQEAYSALCVGRSGETVAFAGAVAIACHVLLARPVIWSKPMTLLWSAIAMSRVLMAVLLIVGVIGTRAPRRHAIMLSVWMIGEAGLFYAAPALRIGYALLWFNLVLWVAWCFVARR